MLCACLTLLIFRMAILILNLIKPKQISLTKLNTLALLSLSMLVTDSTVLPDSRVVLVAPHTSGAHTQIPENISTFTYSHTFGPSSHSRLNFIPEHFVYYISSWYFIPWILYISIYIYRYLEPPFLGTKRIYRKCHYANPQQFQPFNSCYDLIRCKTSRPLNELMWLGSPWWNLRNREILRPLGIGKTWRKIV